MQSPTARARGDLLIETAHTSYTKAANAGLAAALTQNRPALATRCRSLLSRETRRGERERERENAREKSRLCFSPTHSSSSSLSSLCEPDTNARAGLWSGGLVSTRVVVVVVESLRLVGANRLEDVDSVMLLNSDTSPQQGWLDMLREELFEGDQLRDPASDLRAAFYAADDDGDGALTPSELARPPLCRHFFLIRRVLFLLVLECVCVRAKVSVSRFSPRR